MRIDTERDDARERRKTRGRRDKKGAFIMKNEENIRISMLTFEIFYFYAEKEEIICNFLMLERNILGK